MRTTLQFKPSKLMAKKPLMVTRKQLVSELDKLNKVAIKYQIFMEQHTR